MASDELKMVVAENCSEYDSRDTGLNSSVSDLSKSCNNCKHLINDKCVKGVFDEIKRNIKQN